MAETLVYPLGGCGEVGLNSTLFVHDGDALLVDCGALLSVPQAPGIDKAVIGFRVLSQYKLRGVALTHGHEDHIGGLPALLSQFDIPVVGTAITLDFVRSRLERAPAAEAKRQKPRMHEIKFGERMKFGPFEVEWIRMTHSLPGNGALCIAPPSGRIIHTGDFSIDPTPVHGEPSDEARLRELGELGGDLMLADSTNSERDGRTVSESQIAEALEQIVGEATGRIYMTLFASHLHRIKSAVRAAQKHGRRVALLGRSLERTWRMAIQHGIIKPDPSLLIAPEYLKTAPRDRVLVLCTGSQGEWQGGLHKVAHGTESKFNARPGDELVMR